MQILESPLLKNRIAIGCIGLLGLSTFSGLIHTSVSSGFSAQLSQLFNKFGSRGSSAQAGPTGTEGKISPIQWVTEQSKEAWSGYITPFAKTAYEWVKEKNKRDSIREVLKQFWNYKFFKGLMSKSPWIVAGWMSIIADGRARSKLALAWKYSLGFFDHVTKNTGLKDFSSYFGSIFAELLFMPARAIKNFKEKEQLKTQQDPCSSPSPVRKAGETSICISVRTQPAEE